MARRIDIVITLALTFIGAIKRVSINALATARHTSEVINLVAFASAVAVWNCSKIAFAPLVNNCSKVVNTVLIGNAASVVLIIVRLTYTCPSVI